MDVNLFILVTNNRHKSLRKRVSVYWWSCAIHPPNPFIFCERLKQRGLYTSFYSFKSFVYVMVARISRCIVSPSYSHGFSPVILFVIVSLPPDAPFPTTRFSCHFTCRGSSRDRLIPFTNTIPLFGFSPCSFHSHLHHHFP